jgi:hypothetical protein
MHSSHSSLLRNTLRIDAAVCALGGVDLLFFPGPVASLLGLASGSGLMFLGAGLLAYAAFLAVAARREPLSFVEAWTFVAADFAWIVGSAVVIAVAPLTVTGKWLVGAVAAAVFVLAECKLFGIRRVRRGAPRLALHREAA